MEQTKADQPKRAAQKQAEKTAKQKAVNAAHSPEPVSTSTGSGDTARLSIRSTNRKPSAIKTADRGRKGIRQTAKSTGKATVKSAKGTVKTTQRSIKTAEQTARTTVKTTQVTAQAAKAAARKSAEAAKATAKATVSAVKAIIAGTKALITALLAGGWIAVVIILIIVLLGCAVSLFGGGSSSNSYTPVNAEVEAYEPLIRQYAAQHGIPEYVELIKAVMMQESGGRGNDPMQASECGYNTRYPNSPNGITDPEYSMDVGIQNLAACLSAAEVENPIDMEHIKLALLTCFSSDIRIQCTL
ncbi:lysozyme family protein [Oliverpabstia intestinalis]|uniref:lysozyme family protein n=1 Tax=Oliverpabstia intestinalis TaxID=2606633 RepID=UPI003F959C48